MKKIILSIILTTFYINAFTFEKWHSCTKLFDAIGIAQSNNIPLSKQGTVFIEKNFSWKLLNNYDRYRKFYYTENLLGKHARIALHFTDKSKLLYKIVINWSGIGIMGENKKEFLEILYEILEEKYGKEKIIPPSNAGQLIFNTKKAWDINNKTYISLDIGMGYIALSYIDKKCLKISKKEKASNKNKKKIQILIRDKDKF